MAKTLDELVGDGSSLPTDLQVLVRYARFMDAAVRIPGIGVRVGADAAIGLVPVVGDVAGGVVSLYVLITAVRYGVPFPVLLEMALRSAIDLGLGVIMGPGDIFDIFFKDKLANVRLLLEHRTR